MKEPATAPPATSALRSAKSHLTAQLLHRSRSSDPQPVAPALESELKSGAVLALSAATARRRSSATAVMDVATVSAAASRSSDNTDLNNVLARPSLSIMAPRIPTPPTMIPARRNSSGPVSASSTTISPPPSLVQVDAITTAFLNSLKYAASLVRRDDLRMVHVNDTLCCMVGYDADEVRGQPLSLLFPALDIVPGNFPGTSCAEDSLQNFVMGRRPVGTAHAASDGAIVKLISAVHKNGHQVRVELSLSALEHDLSPSLSLSVPSSPISLASSGASGSGRYLLATMRELSPSELSARQSRYQSEFEELELLGKGAYGTVYRARNRIDGQEYAIKKVKLRDVERLNGSNNNINFNSSSLDNFKTIREVKTFARISDHPNVVRYFAAWAEPCADYNCAACDPVGDAAGSYNHDTVSSAEEEELESLADLHQPEIRISDDDLVFDDDDGHHVAVEAWPNQQNFDVVGRNSRKSSIPANLRFSRQHRPSQSLDTANLMKLAGNGQHSSDGLRPRSRSSRRRTLSSLPMDVAARNQKSPAAPVAILYIQMQLCPYNDLRRWLLARNESGIVDPEANNDIFRQIVLGLDHVHRKGFIHRDLKPENIFIQDGHVYLGDFGLAKSIADKVVPPSALAGANVNQSPEQRQKHHADDFVGTYLYTSPEQQLKSTLVTSKTDIYALGMILVELFLIFDTSMERAVVLSQLKSLTKTSRLPAVLEMHFPGYAALARQLLANDARDRPSTAQILHSPLFERFLGPYSSSPLYSSTLSLDMRRSEMTGRSFLSTSGHDSGAADTLSLSTQGNANSNIRRWSSVDLLTVPVLGERSATITPPLSPLAPSKNSCSVQGDATNLPLVAANNRIKELELKVSSMALEIELLRAQLANAKPS